MYTDKKIFLSNIIERKFKIQAVLGIFIFLSSVGPAYASTWQDVLTAYYSAKVQYPRQKIWIERVTEGYRLWRRPVNTTPFMYKVVYKNGVNYTASAGTVSNCSGDGSETFMTDTQLKYGSATFENQYKFCDGTSSVTVGSASVVLIAFSTCWFDTIYNLSVNCKSGDLLLHEFFPIETNCDRPVMTISIGSLSSSFYDSNTGCDCTPNGTVFSQSTSSPVAGYNRCDYTPITGDPTTTSPLINGDAPGFTVLNSTTTSPPVTNPDGLTTTTTTNTFPDGSQDVKTSTTINNITNTTIERFVGGVSLGTTGTSTTTSYADGSTSTATTNTNGSTSTTLTGGGTTQTTSTYSSGLTTTAVSSGGSGGTSITAGSGSGSGSGGTGTGGGTVKIDPETQSAVAPNVSDKPAYNDSRLSGADGKTFGDFGKLFSDFSTGVKSTQLFSKFNFNQFSTSISGSASSPKYAIDFGRYGNHDFDMSRYDSGLYIIKGFILVLASYLATRIVILKR